MFVLAAIVSILLAALLAFAAVRKRSHRPEVLDSYARVGVPEERLDQLAVLLLLGAAGLLAGLLWAPLGIAAAACLLLYFVLAVGAHVRHDDLANLATPVVILLLSAAALALRLATA